MKKKSILTVLLLSLALSTARADDGGDPGFGDEGGNDAALAPTPATAPINENLTLGIISGILLAGYYLVSKRRELN